MANLEIGAVPVSGLMVAALNAQLLGGRFSITTLLLGLGTLVLLVGCENYANLATARAQRRAREIGLRKVIGARRSQIVAQHLLEAGLLTGAGLLIAVVTVYFIAPFVNNAVDVDLRLALDGAGFWIFVTALLVAVTLLGGAYPALVLSRVRPIEALRLGRARSASRFMSTLLVGVQFAAASLLLIAVIVMYVQNAELRRTGLSATRDPHLVIQSLPRVTGVADDTLRAELARIPQVKGITQIAQPPWSEGVNLAVFARAPEESATGYAAFQNFVGYDFFSTLDISLLGGRAFDRARNDALPQNPPGGANPPVNVVIDRVLAADLGFASPEAAVDQTVYFPSATDEPARPVNIIGVVESRPLFLRGYGATANAYFLAPANATLQNHVVRLAADDVAAGVAAVDAMWRQLGAQTALQRRFMDDMFNESYERFARVNQVFVVLAGFAFFISIVGLFGMAIQMAGRRLHEIGVRKSVGAYQRQIVAMLLRDFSKPVVIANLVVWPLGYFAAQAYLSVFIQRAGLTPVPFVLSLAIVVLVAWAAVGSQAIRAARASPATVLRFE
jgi:putative ABC transport system permease protein